MPVMSFARARAAHPAPVSPYPDRQVPAAHAARASARVAAIVAFLTLYTGGADAQVVRGIVVDAASGRAVPGAVIVLLDSAGRRLVGVFAGDDGRYALRAAAPGRFRIRAERIGFRSDAGREVTLGAGETIDLPLVTRPVPVTLSAVTVTARAACVAAADGEAVSEVWEEARKALYATEITHQQELFSARVSRFERMLDARTGRVTSHQTSERSGVTRNPFTSLGADQLSADGYVQRSGSEVVYYAPDAAVLLSNEFLRDHCFQLRRGARGREGLIGLAFEPVRGRRKPDITGTLWIDRRTAELRDLEYRYTELADLPGSVRRDEFGGSVVFRRMPTGAWIVERWVIRMPILGEGAFGGRNAPPIPGTPASGDRLALVAIREEGGEVIETLARGERRTVASRGAAVAGVLFDSTLLAPLPDARVFLDGTQFSARTGADGTFRLDDVPPGTYSVSAIHPRFDSLGVTPPTATVMLSAGETASARLAGPSPATIAARLCPADELRRGQGILRGRVLDSESGKPAGDVPVTITWRTLERTAGPTRVGEPRLATRTDAEGRYAVCGLPADVVLTAHAALRAGRTASIDVKLAAGTIGVLDLSVGSAGGVTNIVSAPVAPIDTMGAREATPARHPAMEAFERRRQRTAGSFMTRAQVERARATRLTDLLRRVPGVTIHPDGAGGGGMIVELRGARRPTFARLPTVPADSVLPPPTEVNSEQFGRASNADRCAAGFYVDGLAFNAGPGIDLDVRPEQVEAIEVYTPGQVPAEFAGRHAACGVIVIWTRQFAEREPR